ncbi:MAG: DUF547 domain-containing protein [Gammaproteobacteria bacterium]|nr:MAG: DUF547 domain-containing protein [Gammaproteobacteria bacterium]
MRLPPRLIPYLLLPLLLLLAGPGSAREPDWGLYGAILADHLRPASRGGIPYQGVDYPALRRDPRWPRLLERLARFDEAALAGRAERLAFWINAYNILAMDTVLRHWPVDSIKEAGGWLTPVWDLPAGTVAGRRVSLGEVEHRILRPMGEPRIHFAIVCASVSCPDLRAEPYTAARLEAQLEDQARRYLASPKGARREGATWHLSRIFAWFEEDFARVGGVAAFVRPRLPASPGAAAPAFQRWEADLPYDWHLNLAP